MRSCATADPIPHVAYDKCLSDVPTGSFSSFLSKADDGERIIVCVVGASAAST